MNRSGRSVVAALVCAVVASSVTGIGEASNHRTIPPGDWVGVITFFGDTGTARGGFEGSFELQAAGSAASGEFGWEGVVATAGAGDVLVTIVGEIGGDTTSPVLSITGGTSAGIPLPDPTGSGNLVLTEATCNGIGGRGANFTTLAQISESDWFAVRAGSAIVSGSFLADLRALRLDAIETVRLLGQRDTSVLTARINQLVADANVLLALTGRGPECQRAEFRSLIGSAVEDLMKAILEDPNLANADVFAELVLIALTAGTWGPGATDAEAFDLEVAIIEDFNRRVDEAIETVDVIALVELGALAYALGFDEAQARIATMLDTVGR